MKEQQTVDQIYEIIEGEITELRTKPNEMLGENSLATRFNVSRTPIRSVLQRLQENGFVKIIPGKGTFVKPISIETASEIIYLRVAVESMVLRDFSTFDINLFLQKDLEMHRIWFQSMDKLYLWNMITKPHPDYSRFIRLDIVGAKNVPDVMRDHKKMMEMIDNKTTDGIEELMREHLYGGVRRLGSKLFSEEYSNYFTSTV